MFIRHFFPIRLTNLLARDFFPLLLTSSFILFLALFILQLARAILLPPTTALPFNTLARLVLGSTLSFSTPLLLLASAFALTLAHRRRQLDREAVALEASGISPSQLLGAHICILIIPLSLTLVTAHSLEPFARQMSARAFTEASLASLLSLPPINTFLNLGQGISLCYLDPLPTDPNRVAPPDTMPWLLVQHLPPNVPSFLKASKLVAGLEPGTQTLVLTLSKGSLLRTGKPTLTQRATFDELKLEMPLPARFKEISPAQHTSWHLLNTIENRHPASEARYEVLEFQKRVALPFAILILPFLLLRQGSHLRGQFSSGYLRVVFFLIVFQVLVRLGDAAVAGRWLPPFVAAWLPVVIWPCGFGVAALWRIRPFRRGP